MDEGLLDTTVFVDAIRGDDGARSLVEQIVSNDLRGHYSPVSVMELVVSRHYSPSEDSFFRGLFARMAEVPFDNRAARLAGMYLRDLSDERREALVRDAIIGTSALVAGLPVYTRNVRDFRIFTDSVRRY